MKSITRLPATFDWRLVSPNERQVGEKAFDHGYMIHDTSLYLKAMWKKTTCSMSGHVSGGKKKKKRRILQQMFPTICWAALENVWSSVAPRSSNTYQPKTSIFQEQVILLENHWWPAKCRTQKSNKKKQTEQRAESLRRPGAHVRS